MDSCHWSRVWGKQRSWWWISAGPDPPHRHRSINQRAHFQPVHPTFLAALPITSNLMKHLFL
ncbi:hypothetical protein AMECASPLE_024817, partial [Ameca splendens]